MVIALTCMHCKTKIDIISIKIPLHNYCSEKSTYVLVDVIARGDRRVHLLFNIIFSCEEGDELVIVVEN